jgi:hypothetical protein
VAPGSGSDRRHGEPLTLPSNTMADRSLVERQLEEIGTQLAWVREYL